MALIPAPPLPAADIMLAPVPAALTVEPLPAAGMLDAPVLPATTSAVPAEPVVAGAETPAAGVLVPVPEAAEAAPGMVLVAPPLPPQAAHSTSDHRLTVRARDLCILDTFPSFIRLCRSWLARRVRTRIGT